MTAPFLRVENLDYAPSKGAPLLLRGVSFALERGTRVALVGRNGAGKTTLLRCVARLVAAPPRAIFLDGRPVESYARNDLARRVAYLGQHSGAYGGATARQVVLLGRLPHLGPFSRLSAEDRSIADEALERVDALRFADRSLDSLSGGERRRVLLAAAFAQDPDLLILDEPTAFLDLPGRRAIDDAIARWRRDKNRTVLETTHDLDALPERFDRVLALRGGELLYDGAPSRVAQPAFLDRLFDLPDPAPSPSTSRPRPDSLLCESSRQDFPRVSAPLTKAATFRRGALLFALLLLALLVLPLLGRIRYPLSTWLDYPGADAILSPRDLVFWHERVPKTCLAALVGAGLSLAGLLTQTLFRNPLATPYTLGVSSGAAFGAILAILSSGLLDALRAPETLLGAPRIVWCAALGAALSTALVYLLSRRAREPDRTLLAGVAVGFFFSSLILVAQNFGSSTQLYRAIHWTTGSLAVASPRILAIVGAALCVVAGVALLRARRLDALLLGDEHASTLGVRPTRERRLFFLLASLLVGTIVAFCGPIGFVGLAVPHAARRLFGSAILPLIPATLALGAIFLAAAQTLARIVLFPSALPVGVVTALVGAPLFLVILLKEKRA